MLQGFLRTVALAGGLVVAGPALAQSSAAYSSDQLLAILTPAAPGEMAMPVTRSLIAGEGVATTPAPGTEGSGVVPDLRLFFPFNSAELTPETRAQLDELGRALKDEQLSGFSFEVGGHTDAAGNDGYNRTLSQRRADAVVGYLSGTYGVARQRLESRGYGEARLAEPDDPMSGRNRRVEIRTIQ